MTVRDVDIVAERAAKAIGEKVRRQRAELELTQESLAERAGISRNQIQNIEHSRNNSRDNLGRLGRGNARLDTVFRLAIALEISPAYLIDPDRRPGDY